MYGKKKSKNKKKGKGGYKVTAKSNFKKKSYNRSYYWMKYFFLSVSLLYMELPAILEATAIVGPA